MEVLIALLMAQLVLWIEKHEKMNLKKIVFPVLMSTICQGNGENTKEGLLLEAIKSFFRRCYQYVQSCHNLKSIFY